MGGMRQGRFRSDRVLKRSSTLLSLMLVGLLLFLASCTGVGQTTRQKATPTPTAKPTQSSSEAVALALKYSQQQAVLQHMYDLYGWMWNVSLPANRLVVYYGNPFSAAMGPIGAYSEGDLLARLRQQAQAYAQLDPAHPVIPALDYVTPVAQGSPMADGTWRARMPDDSIEHYRNLANTNHMLFFVDM